MRKYLELDVKVGLFVTIGVLLIMAAILVLGSTENLTVRKSHYIVHFNSVEGLIPGAKVVLGGLGIGTVGDVEFDPKNRNIVANLTVSKVSSDWIREDSKAEIATQGVLGDKYIAISTGNMEKPKLPEGADIPIKPSNDLSQFLSKGDQLMVTLNSIAISLDRVLKSFETDNRADRFFENLSNTSRNLSRATDKLARELEVMNLKGISANVNNILEKINNGTGTLGALINDPGLYDDAKALMGGASRNRIMRNLVRKTIKESDEAQANEAADAAKSKPTPEKPAEKSENKK